MAFSFLGLREGYTGGYTVMQKPSSTACIGHPLKVNLFALDGELQQAAAQSPTAKTAPGDAFATLAVGLHRLHQEKRACALVGGRMKQIPRPKRTLLSWVFEPYRDVPWCPRGTKCLNGMRQKVGGIRL